MLKQLAIPQSESLIRVGMAQVTAAAWYDNWIKEQQES
jgi:hypothetical protein